MSPKPTSPLLGYNNNVRHRGKVFHVQTEDSGVKYGHIITQLFVDGGRILKSVKTSYAEYVANERRGEIVREMMKQQHKAMFIALRDGRFDAAIDGASSGVVGAVTPPPIASPSRATQPESSTMPAARPGVEAAITEAAAAGADAAVRYAGSELPVPPRVARTPGPNAPATPTVKMASAYQPSPPAAPNPAAAGPARPMGPPSREPTPPTPPAPAAARSTSREPAAPAPVASRYAITRPASIFGQSRPQRGRSVFGDELVSDKSLDEVILSYLAAELENEKK
jgi:hypothetical protein